MKDKKIYLIILALTVVMSFAVSNDFVLACIGDTQDYVNCQPGPLGDYWCSANEGCRTNTCGAGDLGGDAEFWCGDSSATVTKSHCFVYASGRCCCDVSCSNIGYVGPDLCYSEPTSDPSYTCTPGSTESQSCGTDIGECTIGTQSRSCPTGYYWTDWGSCSDVNSSTEICDGLDNDCDGSVDEGVLNACGVCGSVPAETCDGLDNDCDGLVDEDGVCAPILSVPDQTIQEDSGFNDNLVDLHSYTTDPDTALTSLTYSIDSESDTSIVDCSLDSNRYIDCTTQQDQFGYSDVTVSVSDGSDSNTDTFRVTVLNVNDAPTVMITHPDETHNNFVVGFDINLMANVTDLDSPNVTYIINWNDGTINSGTVVNNIVNHRHAYSTTGTKTINLSASDENFTVSDSVDVLIWPYGFNITELRPYNNSDFTNEDYVFYRNEPLYIKFNVIQKDAGFLVPNNINEVYIYNRDIPSSIYDLIAYNGDANGITIVDGQPSTPSGTYYFYKPNLPLSDDILGWNIVFVFSHNGTDAGQAELEIQVLNNPIQLLSIPDVILNQTNGTHIYNDVDLNPYVYDIETPDNEIIWSFSGMINIIVDILTGNIARFYALQGWQGIETLIATADDTDGSTASTSVLVQSGIPSATVLTPNCGEIIYGTTDINWTATDPQGDPITITLEYSPDNSVTWYTIAAGLANTGTYVWNTLGMPQGDQYLVRVTATESNGLVSSDTSDCPFTILSDPDGDFTVKIVADKTIGKAPLEVQFDAITTEGNSPFTYAWDFNSDGAIDSTGKSPKTIFTKEKIYTVVLTATDFDGDVATDTIQIDARGQKTKIPRKRIFINRIIFNDDCLKQGEDLVVTINFENKDNRDMKDSTVTVMVPELDMRLKKGHIDLDTDEQVSKTFVMEVPMGTVPGYYDVLVTIYDDGLKRKRYRPIQVVDVSDDITCGNAPICCD